MEKARRLLNNFIDRALIDLEAADENTILRARKLTQVLLRPFVSLPKKMDPTVYLNVVKILARSIASTPYGAPLQMVAPLFVTIATTKFCPFSCANCYSNSGKIADQATDAFAQTCARVSETPIPFVLVTGGEPATAPDVHEGLTRLLESQKQVSVSVNGAIDCFFGELERWPSQLTMILPVWGNPLEHDAVRGRGSFTRLERNLQKLHERKFRCDLLAVLDDGRLDALDCTIDLARRFEVDSVRITRKLRVGRLVDKDITTPPTDFSQELRRRVIKLKRYVPWVLIDLPEVSRKPSFLSKKLLGIESFSGCSAGGWMMHIDASGIAYPCFTFEGNSEWAIEPKWPIIDQWRAVRELARGFNDRTTCAGERYNSVSIQ